MVRLLCNILGIRVLKKKYIRAVRVVIDDDAAASRRVMACRYIVLL